MNKRNKISLPKKKNQNEEIQFDNESEFLDFYDDMNMNFHMNNSNNSDFYDRSNSNEYIPFNQNSQNVFSEDLQTINQQNNFENNQESNNDSIKISKLLNSSDENDENEEFTKEFDYFNQELKLNFGENHYDFENGDWNGLSEPHPNNRLDSFEYQNKFQEYVPNNDNHQIAYSPEQLNKNNNQLGNSLGNSNEIKNTEEEYEYDTDLKDLISNASISKKLKLSNLGLDKIPSSVWNLTDLVELDLSANQLKRIGKELAMLKCIKLLALNHNTLSKLPNALWKLTSLRKLYLNNNNLKAIPNEIKNLDNLRVLDFSCNNISGEVPSVIANLTALVDLKLRKNQIT
jgi:Leucine-rich repeat (LRR) protein